MNKNVLILSSSPRRGGNSDRLCDAFLQGCKNAGHTVEKIFLKDKHINYCTGCGICSMYGKPCPQKDECRRSDRKNDCRRCHSHGNARLFLYDECTDENPHRPLLRPLHRNHKQKFLFHRNGRRTEYPGYGTHD